MSTYREKDTDIRISRTTNLQPSDTASRRHSRHGSRSPAPSRSQAASPSATVHRLPRKRLIVACDGTWLNSDDGVKNGDIPVPSNVTRIARAIKSESSDGVQQIVSYQEGIGSEGLPLSRLVAGTTGYGLGSDVREGYSFLSTNWAPGDEIFLVGFSRGAFTARSIAGLISEVGLLTKRGLESLVEVFHDVQHRRDPDYRPKYPDVPFPRKPSVSNPAYRQELYRRGLTELNVSVKAVAVFDTVGSLGVPRVGWLTKVGLQSSESDRMQFYDTKLSNTIENAFQALALDEKRSSFSPAVWEKPPGNTTNLRQVWFPGVHSNIGGGYDDQGIANITLAWMMSQLQPFLDFHRGYIIKQEKDNLAYYRSRGKRMRPWSFGKIYDSKTGLYVVGGSTIRTPGQYFQADPDDTTKYLDRPLLNTHEYIHPSVRTRIRLKGPGINDSGRYDPESMDDWRLVVEYADGAPTNARPNIYWRARFRSDNVSTRILPESPLWDLEKELLAMDPETEDFVLYPPPTKRSRRSERIAASGVMERPEQSGGRQGFADDRLVRKSDLHDPRYPTDSKPGTRVLVDQRDEQGGRRVIEQVGPDGQTRVVEERYELRQRGGRNGPLMRE